MQPCPLAVATCPGMPLRAHATAHLHQNILADWGIVRDAGHPAHDRLRRVLEERRYQLCCHCGVVRRTNAQPRCPTPACVGTPGPLPEGEALARLREAPRPAPPAAAAAPQPPVPLAAPFGPTEVEAVLAHGVRTLNYVPRRLHRRWNRILRRAAVDVLLPDAPAGAWYNLLLVAKLLFFQPPHDP